MCILCCCCSLTKSCLDFLWSCRLQHGRLLCPLSPRGGSHLCPLCQWCYLNISSSVIPLSFCNLSFPASGSFLMSWLFASGGQIIGAFASVLSMNIQSWFRLGLTILHSSQSKGLSRVNSSTTIDIPWHSASFMVQVSRLYMTYWINLSSDYRDLCQQSDVSAF